MNTLGVVSIIAAVLLTLFILSISLNPFSRKGSGGFLQLFMGANLAIIVMSIGTGVFRFEWAWAPFLSAAFFFTIPPALYLFLRSLRYPARRIAGKYLLHFIPSVFIFLFLFLKYQWLGTDMDGFYGNDFVPVYGLFFGQGAVYLYFSVKIYQAYQNELKNISSFLEKIRLLDLKILLIIFGIHLALDFGAFTALGYAKNSQLYTLFASLSILVLLLFCFLMIVKRLKGIEPAIFYPFEDTGIPQTTEASIQISQVKTYIEAHKAYMDPDLSISRLATDLKMDYREVSALLNRELGLNFFDFINSYRVSEAKTRIEGAGKGKLTFLEILLASGFNSKSAFNRAFKKHAGMTPREFRHRVRSR